MTPAVRADNISKQYQLGTITGYKTIRESMSNLTSNALRRRRSDAIDRRSIWALRDVSFEIQPGEVVGVIGSNGAGKSTVLKILSRITKPTSGWAEIHGRVGTLLEVGTGFHPELSGRENVYLSGAVLGMRRAEIRARFDEIVEFADIGQFIDTPIKRYSSGMKVRLAFSVAAYFEPEILIVDEVLAVGDLAFQKKCLGKMGEVTEQGRTVLFVSHNMSLIRALCRRGILLEHGRLVVDSSMDEAVGHYLRGLEELGSASLLDRRDRSGWQEMMLSRVDIRGGHEEMGRVVTGDRARFDFHVTRTVSRASCTFTICNHLGQPITTMSSGFPAIGDRDDGADNRFECDIPELLLVPGRYRVDVTLRGKGHIQDSVEGAVFFDVEEGPVRGRPIPEEAEGDVAFVHRWRCPTQPV